jgi:hypothetical protein
MPYIAADPESFLGQVVDTGHCVRLVQVAAHVPHTSLWQQGEVARGIGLDRGTVIATFDDDGHYGNHTDGSSHAAIYLGQDHVGLQVIDQWVCHPTAPRTIRFRGGVGKKVNDGDQFCVVE